MAMTMAMAAASDPLSLVQRDRAVMEHFLPFDRIQLERVLQRGAHGEVWVARVHGQSSPVCIKRILQSDKATREDVDYFVSEIKLTASLSHPNVIRYLGVSWASSATSLCLLLEFHAKGDVHTLLTNMGALLTWPQDKRQLAIGVAQALVYLHDAARPTIHRDLKCANVLISDRLEAVVTDLGVSRDCVEATMTAGVGTPFWVAPEVLNGVRYDTTSDVYSFGVLLSELDTCQTPYHDAVNPRTNKPLRPLQILQCVVNGQIAPKFTRTCPTDILHLAKRCLATNPARRPSARQVLAALLEGSPAPPAPAPAPGPVPDKPSTASPPAPVIARSRERERASSTKSPRSPYRRSVTPPPTRPAPAQSTPPHDRKMNNTADVLPTPPHAALAMLGKDATVCAKWVPAQELDFRRAVAQGKCSEVWRGKFHGTHVAIKRLQQRQGIENEDIERLANEIQLTASLDHPNIIRVLAISWSSSVLSVCMATEYHENGTLERVLQTRGTSLSWQHKCKIAGDVALALEYLHERPSPIIHRDIKAKNVLVTGTLDGILFDFSVSRDRGDRSMTAGVGTPYWVAPEMLKGERYNECSDIYSFGVLLSEIDTGQLPYRDLKDPKTGEKLHPFQILRMILQGVIRPQFSADCPRQMLRLARQCLEHNPAARPEARDLVDALRCPRARRRSQESVKTTAPSGTTAPTAPSTLPIDPLYEPWREGAQSTVPASAPAMTPAAAKPASRGGCPSEWNPRASTGSASSSGTPVGQYPRSRTASSPRWNPGASNVSSSSSSSSASVMPSFPTSLRASHSEAAIPAEVPHSAMAPLLQDAAVFSQFIAASEIAPERSISRGAHGEVWSAMVHHERVAIKRIVHGMVVDTDAVDAFVAEIQLTAVLNHPNIIQFRGVSWTSDSISSLCLVMEFHSNGNVEHVLKSSGDKMSWQREKRELVRDIAMALHYLHDRATPIIHRDVRAKNVVLSEKFKGVLIDFAVSRDRALATMTAGVGTPFWVAPEILRNVKYDERSDIYSFGVLLTELDTCKRPYHDLKDRRSGKELRPLQILPMVMAGTARPSLTKDCPQDIRALAKRCLDPDPMRRPTASDVLKVLHGSDRSEAKQSPVLTMEQLSISEPPIAPSTAPSSTSYMPAVADAVFEPLQQDRNVRERWVPLDSVVMEQLIARGEFGEVWLARLRGEAVAVKRLPQSAELEREDVELFVHEIKLTASLSHANVIRFRGLSWSPTATHSLCMALDYHSQGTLQRMLRRAGNMMNWTHKLHFALGIAQALHYLHGRAHPVIHRDVKSKNVVVSDKCEAILIDFSIGRESVQKTMTMGVGTPYWTAPEQLKGSRYDSTSDIYAFGVFLSELDTCQEPYHDAKDPKTGRLLSPLQILRMVTNGRIVPTFTRECPMRVLQAAQRCLEFNSADRPSARELVQMLKSSRRK